MKPIYILLITGIYFLVLLLVSWLAGRKSDNESFFIGNKKSNWMLVAFGMVGTSLSGVTYISVPGTVGFSSMGYFQIVLGYFIGYFAIAFILLPLYYRLNLTSIYSYLGQRFGATSHKTGSAFFILSRTLGATMRLYLVINVMQLFLVDSLRIPFWVTATLILLMILLYTFQGGVKTIVWTDTLQTTFMLGGLIICIIYILRNLHMGGGEALTALQGNGFTSIFNTDPAAKGFFLKQILGGAFITLTMTGMDQEMMQKNISVKTLKGSRKNMISFSFVLMFVNLLFLVLGGLMYLYALKKGGQFTEYFEIGKASPVKEFCLDRTNVGGDDLFPTMALQYLPPFVGVIFIIGLISALFPSADGAITALTSSFCLDLLDFRNRQQMSEAQKTRLRRIVHLSFAALFLICVLIFKVVNNKSIIDLLLKTANYTYGPLLGLFAFGIFTRLRTREVLVPVVCILGPLLGFGIDLLLGGAVGLALLPLNGLLVFLGLLLISRKESLTQSNNL